MSTKLTGTGLALCINFAASYTLNVFVFEYFQTRQEAPLGQLILFRGTLVIWVIALIYLVFPQNREIILQGFDLAFGTELSINDDHQSGVTQTRLSVEYAELWILLSTVASRLFGLVFWLICLKEMSSGDMILILEVSNTIVSILYAMFWLRERINPVSLVCFLGIIIGLTVMLRPTFLFGPEKSDELSSTEEKDFRHYSVWSVACALGIAATFFISDAALYRFRDKVDPKVLTLAGLWQEILVYSIAWIFIIVVFGFDEAWTSLETFSPLSMAILWMFAPLEVINNASLILALTSVPFYFFNCMGSLSTLLCYLMDVWLLNEVEHWTVYAGASIIVCSLVFLTCDSSHSDANNDKLSIKPLSFNEHLRIPSVSDVDDYETIDSGTDDDDKYDRHCLVLKV